MNRIDTLHIQNFKFFQKQDPIKLGSKHLLLYGENGSGKSSVYWSLYTLFEASLKREDVQIHKYFSKKIFDGEDSLVNIHAPETAEGSDDYNSFVEVKTDNAPHETYRISAHDVAIRGNEAAKFINYASDFINYRLLLGFSAFRHSRKMNLFGVFVEDIFKYVQFKKVEFTIDGDKKDLTNALEIWEAIERGPDEFDYNKDYTKEELDAYKLTAAYTDFVKSFEEFHNRLQELLDLINLNGPAFFKRLGYDIPYVLSLTQGTFELKSKEYILKDFKISVDMPEYEKVPNAIKKPHSFLNEAKLSALAISIRLAILGKKITEACLKFIVLDDLLISLDMSNREKVLDVLLAPEFSDNYQLIILTHDMSFFQLCQRKIAELGQKKWVYYEMYADEEKHVPVILPSETYFSKACFHLKQFDYPASGNYFRKAAEDIFQKEFPREVTISDNGQEKEALKNYIDSAIKFYDRIGQSTANLKALDNYLFLLLNPLSHRDIETDIYRYELDRVRELLPKISAEVKALNFRELVAATNTLVIKFPFDATTEFEYFIKTKEPIYLYNNAGTDALSNSKCKSYQSSTITNGGVPVIVPNEHYDYPNIVDVHKQVFINKKLPYDNSSLNNIFHQAFNNNDRTSLQHLIDEL